MDRREMALGGGPMQPLAQTRPPERLPMDSRPVDPQGPAPDHLDARPFFLRPPSNGSAGVSAQAPP